MSEGTGRDPVGALLAASMDGVAVLADGVHDRTNEPYAATFGADPGTLVDAEWRRLYPERVRDRIAAVSGDGGGTTATLRDVDCERVDGESVSVDLRVRGTPTGAVVVVRERPDGDGDRRRDAQAEHERLLTALHDAAREIQEARSVEAVAERAVAAAHDVLGWPLSAYWHDDEATDALERVTARGGPGIETLAEGDPGWEVFVAGEPRIVDVGAARSDLPVEVGEGMLFPLGDHGLLEAAVPDDRSPAEWELEAMELLAAHAESALARVERERELRRAKRRYRTLAENIPDGAVSLFEATDDGDFRYTLVAGTLFENLDMTAEEMEGQRFSEFHTDAYRERHASKYRSAIEEQSASTFEFSFGERIYRGHTLPVETDDPDPVAMLMTLDVTEQRERERELRRRRDELATLNGINELLLNITRALSEAPGRDELEEIVCERLAESDLYRFAWIGERAIDDEAIVVRTSAGADDGYLEAVAIDDGEVIPGDGPAGRAMRTGEVEVVRDVLDDDSFEEWRDAADARGFRSAAAVPLVHGETVYGLLAVYSGRPDAFSDREQAAFAILGETIGFVINAIGNRKLLVADTVTELTFEGTGSDELLVDCSQRVGATVSLEGYTQTDDDVWLVYLSIDGESPEEVAAFLRDRPGIDDAWVIESGEDGGGVGLRDRSPSFLQSVLSAGATLQEATATDGVLRAVVEVPGSADVRNVVDLLRDDYPSIEFVAQHDRDRPVRTVAEFRDGLEAGLTGRQRAALQAAYYAGYFDWPRESTAEDVAESMGISSATLHNHLRKAQHRLLSLFFDEESD